MNVGECLSFNALCRVHNQNRSLASNSIQETWMKLAKTSVIACGISAFLAYSVIVQSLATDARARKGMQDRSVQSGMSDDDDSLPKLRTAGGKVGRKSTKGAKRSLFSGEKKPERIRSMAPRNSSLDS